ncbi:MAG: tRNA (adenosine(37)-N6)-threonylcarbamoyltransferase complex ATPase subunit type 1 TsaE [Flavobacteriaceae bacterium]|jgi:tRNA threonylcarbamoyladenosine biosynthesis protein TsaE|nr:tRNA (adenosine(37)-N6)-threonylcarbamoyltransferase complex ATPase subunit type 1 TsaE [Flavobacteriaceae bacterium]|tara:strand:+ start:160 stop:567 length:408 start_codon:yes stop_codon:yes gene_type:complete
MELIYSLTEINYISKKISKQLNNQIVLFKGPMGSGKTTLIKSICKYLNFNDNISSPTFSLVNTYENSTNNIIYHFDLFRIKNLEEALDIGIEEYLDSGNKCFIEWPEIINELLDFKCTTIEMSVVDDNKRRIKIN